MIPVWILALPTLAAVLALWACGIATRRANRLRRLAIHEGRRAARAEINLAMEGIVRSERVSRGNRTRAANRKALQDAMTDQLKAN